MNDNRCLHIAISVGLLVLITFFSYQQWKAKSLVTGTVWKVMWSDGNRQTGLYRENMPKPPDYGQGGEYNVDMYGVLHPNFLEIRFPNRSDSHIQIIPLRQISWLEFGNGGVRIDR